VRKLWPAIVVLCLTAVVGGGGTVGAATPPAAPANGYVVVQFAGGATQAQTAGTAPPTLAERGFRHLAVPAGETRDQFLAQLRARPDVISAQPDATVYAANIPNDPDYLLHQAQYLAQIHAPQAWDLATGSHKVVVAVLDSGLDLTHPDFAGRLWQNPADAFSDGIDHDSNGCVNDRYGCRFITLTAANARICGYTSSTPTGQVMDDDRSSTHGHGTFVSGIIGAAGDNNIGVTGVAWDVQLMTVKVLDCGTNPGGSPSGSMYDVAQGIEYATRMGANIINLSLATAPGDQSGDIPALRTAIQDAQNAGVIIVAAAGNHAPGTANTGVGYPGAYTSYPNLVTVGASDNLNGNIAADYTNYGPSVDLAAPGNSITSTIRSDTGLANPYGTSGTEGGTSYSTPLVTGMFALMMSRNSRLGYQQYINLARGAATPPAPGPPNWAGAGVIDIGAAVASVPMTVTGSALHDWKDVPPGTEVRATVDGITCGITDTTAFGVVARYTLQVNSAATQAGCGVPGKTVQISIGGAVAQPTLTWGGLNTDLGLANRDETTVSPPPGVVVVQPLNGVWSNIAYLEAPAPGATAFASLPTPWSAAFHWDATKPGIDGVPGAFQRYLRSAPPFADDWPTIRTYDAYWVDAPAVNVASLNPNPPAGRVLDLKPGWNNFTYTGTSKAVADALSQVSGSYTQVLQYDNPSQKWLSYLPGQPRYLEDFGGLFKLKVYWVYMTTPGSITMN